jgi:PAS domain S-box-containing protein
MESKTIKLLLLEDEAAHAEAIRRALKSSSSHFHVTLVGTLKEYHESVAADPPDIALLDMILPDGRSLELMDSSPETRPFPVLIMTSRGDERTAVAAMKAGALDYIVKSPETFTDMPHKLTRALDHWKLLQERKQALEALEESEERYRFLFENAHDTILIAIDGTLKFVNSRVMELSGYTREELIGKPFREIIHPDDRQAVFERYLRWLTGGSIPDTYTFRIFDKSGNIKWVELNAVLITWEGRTATLNFLTDITDRKQLEEERQRAEKLEAVGRLAGGIAHDFNNILTAILGNISLARMEAAPGSELSESLEQAERASLRAKDLTVQLLTFSKGGAPVKKLASLKELLRDTVDFALRGSNVKCLLSIPDDLWPAQIDPGQISQVVRNLVINAQQAMPGGGTMELRTENMAMSETQSLGKGLPLRIGNYVRISVADHGTGIPGDHLKKIFEPFFTTKPKNSGMGLAATFSMVQQHGGHISVESKLGTGSTFYLYLPASVKTASD